MYLYDSRSAHGMQLRSKLQERCWHMRTSKVRTYTSANFGLERLATAFIDNQD